MSALLLAALWRASWQGALVIVLVIAVVWCFCRGGGARLRLPADIRCWLWRGVYVKLLLGLVIGGNLAVVLPILPAATNSAPSPVVGLFLTPPVPSVPREALARTDPRVTSLINPCAAARQKAPAPPLPWQKVLFALYLLGISVCFTRILRAGLHTHQILRAATVAAGIPAGSEIADLATRLGLPRVPRLMRSAGIDIPVYVAGAVLLPRDAVYTSEELRLILAHELAHARRRDLVWEWLGTLTQVVFFFHPLVLLARREERLARESAADALALRITRVPAAVYGKLLLSISLAPEAGLCRKLPLVGAVGAAESGTSLRRRLLALKEVYSMPATSDPPKRLAFLIAAGLVVFVPWRITEAAPAAPAPSTTRLQQGSSTAPLYLRNVPDLPLIPLAEALKLTPVQKAEISRIQNKVRHRQENQFLQQREERSKLDQEYLPHPQPPYFEATRTFQDYKSAMHQTIERGIEKKVLLESDASRDVLAVLTTEQETALPALLQAASTLRSVGIPPELYTNLNLDANQKRKIAAIVRARLSQVSLIIAKSRAEDNAILATLSQGIPQARQQAMVKAREQRLRSFKELHEAMQQGEVSAHEAAFAVLTGAQRNTVTSYLQAYPKAKRS